MNSHALSVLEFGRVLDAVAGRATSDEGASRVRALGPSSDRAWIEREQSRVFAVRALVASDLRWAPHTGPSARLALSRLRVEGASLGGSDFVLLRSLLRASRTTADSLADPRLPAAAIAVIQPVSERLVRDPRAEQAIDRAIDDDGNVRDDASPALRAIRRELRTAEGMLVSLLERLMSRLEASHQVADMSVTVRNGRYVIPVRREGRATIGGIVHDASGSGGTLFIEPPAAVEAGNRIRELESDETEEVQRILAALADTLRPSHEGMVGAMDALAELDSLYARARYAHELGASPVDLRDPGAGFAIVGGRHPLLLAQGHAVVPFDLSLDADERTFLISGPNTGGKTVLLKALALLSASVQSGVPATVLDGTSIAVYDDIYADIGDEQSIEASLSTFSAHVKNLREILSFANSSSLVLIDELGSGTDPLEGAALGGAVLESLTARGARTVATTHLGALKQLAIENASVINGSLQFDAVALAPTYRLIKGIPGQSYGLSIARRLGVPADVLDRAESRLPHGERDVNALLADLEARETALSEREREAAAIAEDARTRAARVAERERNAGLREREAEREARREARKHLLAARREIEDTIASLKASADTEATAREARRHVEELAGAETAAIEKLDMRDRGARPKAPPAREITRPVAGDYVAVETLGGRVGQLLEIRDGAGIVAVGPVKLTLPLGDLSPAQRPTGATGIQVRGDAPEIHVQHEIDVRGMRVSEVEDIVMHAVDNAVRADLKALRIIHGKGTGALRERIAEMLKKESRVANFRLGAWNEGGAGVTVAEIG